MGAGAGTFCYNRGLNRQSAAADHASDVGREFPCLTAVFRQAFR